MDEKLKEYWSTNKLMFFLVVIPLTLGIIAFTLRDLIFATLVNSANKTVDQAKKEDSQLQATSAQAAQDAAKAGAEAQDAEQRIADRKENDIPDDWNKK